MQITRFIDPEWLVEIEADAVVEPGVVNLDVTLKPNRVIRVYSATGNVAVNLFGVVT